MELPETHTTVWVSWQEYSKYLMVTEPEFKDRRNGIWGYFVGYCELHNGVILEIEHPDNLRDWRGENEDTKDFVWFAECLHRDYPEVCELYGNYVPLLVAW